MTRVDSHVASIGFRLGTPCLRQLHLAAPSPSLSDRNADPAAVLGFLKEKSRKERAPGLRIAIYASALRARSEESEPRTLESPTPLAFHIAKLGPDMARVIVEFAHGVVKKKGGGGGLDDKPRIT
jgi:hypothetical protein